MTKMDYTLSIAARLQFQHALAKRKILTEAQWQASVWSGTQKLTAAYGRVAFEAAMGCVGTYGDLAVCMPDIKGGISDWAELAEQLLCNILTCPATTAHIFVSISTDSNIEELHNIWMVALDLTMSTERDEPLLRALVAEVYGPLLSPAYHVMPERYVVARVLRPLLCNRLSREQEREIYVPSHSHR